MKCVLVKLLLCYMWVQSCPNNIGIIVLMKISDLGITVWVEVKVNSFLFQHFPQMYKTQICGAQLDITDPILPCPVYIRAMLM
jgi:hypothetical protein